MIALTDLATIHTTKPLAQPDLGSDLMDQAIDIAEQYRLTEASVRLMVARRLPTPWRRELFVRRLDDKLPVR